MLTTQEAAKILNISEARVRALISDNGLAGEKRGRQWFIHEWSVNARLQQGAHPGRPSLNQATVDEELEHQVAQAHLLYLQCKEVLAGGYDPDFLMRAETPEEREFFLNVANFFLAKKQHELVVQGVF